jgi:hypothetical protein
LKQRENETTFTYSTYMYIKGINNRVGILSLFYIADQMTVFPAGMVSQPYISNVVYYFSTCLYCFKVPHRVMLKNEGRENKSYWP